MGLWNLSRTPFHRTLSSREGKDIIKDSIPGLVLHITDVYDHVDFIRTCLHSVLRFRGLGAAVHCSKRKTDNGAYLHPASLKSLCSKRNTAGVDTHGCERPCSGLITELYDLSF